MASPGPAAVGAGGRIRSGLETAIKSRDPPAIGSAGQRSVGGKGSAGHLELSWLTEMPKTFLRTNWNC